MYIYNSKISRGEINMFGEGTHYVDGIYLRNRWIDNLHFKNLAK